MMVPKDAFDGSVVDLRLTPEGSDFPYYGSDQHSTDPVKTTGSITSLPTYASPPTFERVKYAWFEMKSQIDWSIMIHLFNFLINLNLTPSSNTDHVEEISEQFKKQVTSLKKYLCFAEIDYKPAKLHK
ncbi:hypothetical protein L2E82_07152 [Cichorium intybus]|uniref:Uncharacterized protein n=1 Tax=Cichorium intybus TaxID=13427 RepID=A0ACB9G4X2_CICIN|nr:hypothetical protein L2E82_07152 [Cichorium intybus]